MHTGDLRERIHVYQNTPTRNDDGQQVEVPTLYCTRRAKVAPVAGNERRVGEQVAATTDYLVTIRSDAVTRAITPAMWLAWGSRRLNIGKTYDLGADREWVEMQCTERVE